MREVCFRGCRLGCSSTCPRARTLAPDCWKWRKLDLLARIICGLESLSCLLDELGGEHGRRRCWRRGRLGRGPCGPRWGRSSSGTSRPDVRRPAACKPACDAHVCARDPASSITHGIIPHRLHMMAYCVPSHNDCKKVSRSQTETTVP